MDQPFLISIATGGFIPEHFHSHVERRLSSMKGYYLDGDAFARALEKGDPVMYEVYEFEKRPEVSGELLSGVSIVHSGKIGTEYNMTKGHFHQVIGTSEVYYCLAGEGIMVMETPEGETSVETLVPGSVLYVPPRWAHRSVNTATSGDFITLFVYPAEAGHDYGTIERRGFRKLVVEEGGTRKIIANPRWTG